MHNAFRIETLCLILFSLSCAANPLADDKNVNIRGKHPLGDGLNAWYYGLDTALGGHIYIGDVLDGEAKFFNYQGTPKELHKKNNETADNYENQHNHYQNLFVQTLNKVRNLNAVSIWGDSTSVGDGAKSWGGFFSARSACKTYAKGGPLERYGSPDLNCHEVDNQLIGIEIDVLNNSKPGVFPNMSKTGLQIVGFGNPNSMAIEVRSEDTDRLKQGAVPRGAFSEIFYVKNSIQPEYGRLVVADFDRARIGLDLRKPIFTEGAVQFRSDGVGTGILINGGISGEVYGGPRWTNDKDGKDWITVRMGDGGFRISSNDNTKEVFAVDNFGGVYLNGDFYLNGKRLTHANDELISIRVIYFSILLVALNAIITFLIVRLKSKAS